MIVARIVEGSTPAGIDTKRLTQTDATPIRWADQRSRFGFTARGEVARSL
jgi:hypothetical protein